MSDDGRLIVEEYEALKRHILADSEHTRREGKSTIVRSSLRMPERGNVTDKIRGGTIVWDDDFLGQPCTRVDDDPLTFDRISVERTVKEDGKVRGTSSIIFTETTVFGHDGTGRLVVEKIERYTRDTDEGPVTGELFTRVLSPSGEVLEHRHQRATGPTQGV